MKEYDVVEVGDQNELVPTSKYPYAKLGFEFFNPVQSRLFEFYDESCNIIVASTTGSGKTICAEMVLAYEMRHNHGKTMYLSPQKSLTRQKIDEWVTNHHFSDLKLSICTGDYRLTPDRRQELINSNLILMTSEMLNSRGRNFRSENNTWIKDLRTIVVDESHLLGVEGRGDHLEAGIMKLTEVNSDCRLVFLSATMPNLDEIGEWLCHLTKRRTYIIKSTYRPIPLVTHYIPYDDSPWKYQAREQEKINSALDIVRRHPNDKFLLFAHSKDMGRSLVKALKKIKIDAEFHNGDLANAKRIKIENDFADKNGSRVLVATSTLAWGCNLPARRVIVMGIHRGLSEVPVYDITQEIGRSGRPGYDPRGDAYVLIPNKNREKSIEYLTTPQPILSQILDESGNYKVLAFHLVSEIHHGDIKTVDDIHKWYHRSLAYFQNRHLHDTIVDDMICALKNRGIIQEDEQGELTVTSIGKIASMFYYSPFDVADLKRNFNVLFKEGKERDDVWIAFALANIESYRMGIVSNADREAMGSFKDLITHNLIMKLGNGTLTDSVKKMAFCYYGMLNGCPSITMSGITKGLQADFMRLAEVIHVMESMLKWDQKQYIRDMTKRVSSGVDWEVIELCRIPGIAKVKARKLWDASLTSLERVAAKPNLVKLALKCSDAKAAEISTTAAKLLKETK